MVPRCRDVKLKGIGVSIPRLLADTSLSPTRRLAFRHLFSRCSSILHSVEHCLDSIRSQAAAAYSSYDSGSSGLAEHTCTCKFCLASESTGCSPAKPRFTRKPMIGYT